jgi:hypothetical protein
LNGDGNIDSADLAIVRSNYLARLATPAPAKAGPAQVPVGDAWVPWSGLLAPGPLTFLNARAMLLSGSLELELSANRSAESHVETSLLLGSVGGGLATNGPLAAAPDELWQL